MIALGKPYLSELSKIENTIKWSAKVEIPELTEFVKSSFIIPMRSVGSGGSYTAALFASMLHEKGGTISKAITPLELQCSDHRIINESSFLFLTSRGSNNDIINAFRYVMASEPQNVSVLCTATNSKIAEQTKKYENVNIQELELPTGRDGFLATNSLVASLILLLRAYSNVSGSNWISPSFTTTLEDVKMSNKFTKELNYFATWASKIDTLILLYGEWGKVAAIDAESKFSETGLVNTSIADFRNFAHGRHNWFTLNGAKSGVIALSTLDDDDIARKTLDQIPYNIPRINICTMNRGPIAALDLLLFVFQSVQIVGKLKNIDPGNPHIPEYGRRLYHLNFKSGNNKVSNHAFRDSIERLAVYRKLNRFQGIKLTDEHLAFWSSAYRNFVRTLESAKFGSVVFDYDGTMISERDRYSGLDVEISRNMDYLLSKDILIGVATGRGKSAVVDLRRAVSENYWDNVYMATHSGSEISTLGGIELFKTTLIADHRLSKLYSYVNTLLPRTKNINFKIKERQMTIECDPIEKQMVKELVTEAAHKFGYTSLRILLSSHSVDVISPGASKSNLVKSIGLINHKNTGKELKTLTLGDSGNWPGNDFYLLSHKYSLSVNHVSSDPNSCWNLAPAGHKGVQALKDYLGAMNVHDSNFTIKVKSIGGA